MTNQELRIEYDMLKGNINRMMVTNDLEELHTMYDFAKVILEKIYTERIDNISIKSQY